MKTIVLFVAMLFVVCCLSVHAQGYYNNNGANYIAPLIRQAVALMNCRCGGNNGCRGNHQIVRRPNCNSCGNQGCRGHYTPAPVYVQQSYVPAVYVEPVRVAPIRLQETPCEGWVQRTMSDGRVHWVYINPGTNVRSIPVVNNQSPKRGRRLILPASNIPAGR